MTPLIHNGQVWLSPSMMEVVVQWLDKDTYILLGAPSRSVDGGTCMVALSRHTGVIIYTEKELILKFSDPNWRHLPSRQVTIEDRS